MLVIGASETVDWFLIFNDLDKVGVKMADVSRILRRSGGFVEMDPDRPRVGRTTLHSIKHGNSQPRFREGMMILSLWAMKTGKTMQDIPTIQRPVARN